MAYFTAVAHEQRATDLAGRKDEMSEAVQTVKAADAGIESINTLIAAAKSLATSALSADATTARRLRLMTSTTRCRTQIDRMAADSGYKGVNLLGGTDTVTHGQIRRGTAVSNLSITGFDATTTDAGLSIDSTATGG